MSERGLHEMLAAMQQIRGMAYDWIEPAREHFGEACVDRLDDIFRDADAIVAAVLRQAGARKDIADEFPAAMELAGGYGMRLKQNTAVHFQLFWGPNKKWLLNIYPGNQRLYGDPSRRGPFLQMPGRGSENPWTLSEVVEAAMEADYQAEQEGGSDE